MASLRKLKKDIDYLTSEVISDAYLALYFGGPGKKEEIVKIIEETVALRNELFRRGNNPVEKKNAGLVKKHYAQLRRDLLTGIDVSFGKLSEVVK